MVKVLCVGGAGGFSVGFLLNVESIAVYRWAIVVCPLYWVHAHIVGKFSGVASMWIWAFLLYQSIYSEPHSLRVF